MFPSDFAAGYSRVRASPSTGVPSALLAEKTKGSANFLPFVISFGEESF